MGTTTWGEQHRLGRLHTARPVMQRVAMTHQLASGWKWLCALGAVQLVGGVAALARPVMATYAVTLLLAVAFLAWAVVGGVHAYRVRGFAGTTALWCSVALMAVAGVLLIANPFAGAAALTAFLAAFFMLEGASRTWLAFQARPHKGWGWVLFGGLCGVALGVFLLTSFPVSALSSLGLLAGINLTFAGVSSLVWAWGLHQADRAEAPRL